MIPVVARLAANVALLLMFSAGSPAAEAAAEGSRPNVCPPAASSKQEASPFEDEDPSEPMLGPDVEPPEQPVDVEGAPDKSSVPADDEEEMQA